MGLREAMASISAVTGRTLPTLSLPAWTLLWPMRAVDSIQRRLPFRLPFDYQSVYSSGLGSKSDDSVTRRDFGIEARPLNETISDTLKWMVESGYLSRALAGRLFPKPR